MTSQNSFYSKGRNFAFLLDLQNFTVAQHVLSKTSHLQLLKTINLTNSVWNFFIVTLNVEYSEVTEREMALPVHALCVLFL